MHELEEVYLEIIWPILIKFHVKHLKVEEKASRLIGLELWLS